MREIIISAKDLKNQKKDQLQKKEEQALKSIKMTEGRSFKGVNWGMVNFTDDHLVITSDTTHGAPKKRLFKLSLKKFTNSIVTKADIVIDLNTTDLADQ